VIDLLKAFDYSREGKVFLYEALGGIPIYETNMSHKIRDIWLSQYNFSQIGVAINGAVKQ